MLSRKVYIRARTLESARNIARQLKTVVVYSGKYLQGIKPEHGSFLYSFEKKEQ